MIFPAAIKSCVCKPVGFPDADVNPTEIKPAAKLLPVTLWWLWELDAVLVSAGFLFYLATNYGTYEFFGRACAMALLPLIPVMVLVGGAGSTIFALTKVLIEKRSLSRLTALALLVGPALVVTLTLGLLGAFKSPAHRLSYVCIGHAPAVASQVRITGYSTFLREEWLAVFHTEARAFQAFAVEAQLAPADELEIKKVLAASGLKGSRLFQDLPPLNPAQVFKRVFKAAEEHQRGSVYAVFDAATGMAVVFRAYRD